MISILFLGTCLVALAASIYWPRLYTSDVAIFVEQKNILGRLMEGAAVQTGIVDQARLAGEILFSRRIMNRLLEKQGFMEGNPSALAIAEQINDIRGRTSVSVSSPNLITIEYSDRDAETAFLTTKMMSEAFMEESARSKLDESNSAYTFIDIQVKEYEEKLRNLEEKLKEFRSGNESITPGAEGQIRSRIAQLRTEISGIEQSLREADIREANLREQLSGEDKTASIAATTNSYQTRIAALKSELDKLRLTYREEYPDIIQIKEQIAALEERAKLEGKNLSEDTVAVPDGSGSTMSLLQQNYYETKILVATLTSRLADSRTALSEELGRARDIPAVEAQLKEISREYDVNQTIYSDLLHRREIARVSMNVDREQQGLTLKIHEDANFPVSPGGPKTYQILAAGILFGLLAPIGGIAFLQNLDGRIRFAGQITEKHGVPVISSVPHMMSPAALRRQKYGIVSFGLFILVTTSAVIATSRLWTLGYITL